MKITVVGAGAVGASCAEYIAIKDFASEVVLLDIKEGFAEGKAMDLMQTASLNNFDTKTPMVQVIPFKRQDWEMEVGITDWDEWKTHQGVLGNSGDEAYKKNFHIKKKFT